MITEKDIKALRRHQSRSGRIASWAVVIAPVFLVVMGVLNLHLASKIGSIAGVDLVQLFQSWIAGVNVNTQYSGLYLKAMERLTTALLHFCFAIILFIFAYGYHSRRKLDSRILGTLKRSGVLKD